MNKYQLELRDWEEVNKQLDMMDLPSVQFICPPSSDKPENTVMIKRDVTRRIRENLMELMKKLRDERRENGKVVANLTTSNEQIWGDMMEYKKAFKDNEDKLADTKDLLEEAKLCVKELDAELSATKQASTRQLERMVVTKDSSQTEHQRTELKCIALESELQSLRAELESKKEEEMKRTQRQREIFKEFQQKTSKAHGAIDQKLLDVIDSYESELSTLKKGQSGQSPQDKKESSSESEEKPGADFDLTYASSNLKELIRSYERGLRYSRKQAQSLEERNEDLERQLVMKPSSAKYRELQSYSRKLEGIIKEHGLRLPPVGRGARRRDELEGEFSLALNDLDYLPPSLCRKYLRVVCSFIDVTDLENLMPTMQEIKACVEGYPKLEQIASHVLRIVTRGQPTHQTHCRGDRKHAEDSRKGGEEEKDGHQVWCDRQWAQVLPVLDSWSGEMGKMHELQRSIAKLQSLYLGKGSVTVGEGKTRVRDLVDAISCLIVDRNPVERQGSAVAQIPVTDEKIPSGAILLKMVRHFQHLFDCPRIAGVYPLLNSIYSQIHEQKNMMKAIRGILGLGESVKGSEVVDAIGRICDSYRLSALDNVRKLLSEEDLETVVGRLDEHKRFFPLFTQLMNELMETLEVTRVDEVVPAAKALKLLSS